VTDASTLPATIGPYRNRIIGLRVMPVGELLDHPENWRRHPQAQLEALEASLRQIGTATRARGCSTIRPRRCWCW